MSAKDRLLICLERIIDTALFIYFLLFLLAGAYTVYDSQMVLKENSESLLRQYRPDSTGKPTQNGEIIKEKYAGWITIDDTGIDYPVMRGSDNFEFLNIDPFGNSSLGGSIFMDARNSMDFTDPYTLLYGHHLDGELLFGKLDRYLDKGYLEEHRTGTVITETEKFDVRLFAVCEVSGTDPVLFSPTEADDKITDKIRENHLYLIEDGFPKDGERLIGLSTCKFPDVGNRTVVMGTIEPSEGELP